jgi:hypothetical protein
MSGACGKRRPRRPLIHLGAIDESLRSRKQRFRLPSRHFLRGTDSKQISQRPAARCRFELGFGTLRSVSVLHFSLFSVWNLGASGVLFRALEARRIGGQQSIGEKI